MIRTTVFLTAAIAIASPAIAQNNPVMDGGATTPAAASAVAQQPAPPAKDAKICKRIVPTGSIMSIKTCRTKGQWDAMSDSGQENIQQLRDRSAATMGAPLGN